MDDGDRGVFAPLGFRQAVLYSNVRHAVGRFRSKTSSASNSESLDFLHPHWLQRSALFQLGLQLVLGQQIGHPNCVTFWLIELVINVSTFSLVSGRPTLWIHRNPLNETCHT